VAKPGEGARMEPAGAVHFINPMVKAGCGRARAANGVHPVKQLIQ
jgi:hypothetical protein